MQRVWVWLIGLQLRAQRGPHRFGTAVVGKAGGGIGEYSRERAGEVV